MGIGWQLRCNPELLMEVAPFQGAWFVHYLPRVSPWAVYLIRITVPAALKLSLPVTGSYLSTYPLCSTPSA